MAVTHGKKSQSTGIISQPINSLYAQRRRWWIAAMIASILAVGALELVSESREAHSAVERQARRYRLIALTLSMEMASRLDLLQSAREDHGVGIEAHEAMLATLLDKAREFQRLSDLQLVLKRPDMAGYLAADGAVIASAALDRAFSTGAEIFVLSEQEAAALGWTGIASVGLSASPRLQLAVVGSATPEIERSAREGWRTGLSLLLVAGIVLVFGGATLRQQQREHELSSRLAGERAEHFATLAVLSTGVAHELATPLAVIGARVEMLQNEQRSDGSERNLAVIARQVERMDGVIRGLLALARGDTPKLELISPAVIGREAIERVLPRFQQARVELDSTIAANLPRISCEPQLFAQVLVNLLVNACQASTAGAHVSLGIDLDHDRVRFSVSDEGDGIDDVHVERLKQPFVSTKKDGMNAGLGLAISAEIVQQHHGTISLRSRKEEGVKGTRATVELPAGESHG